MPKMKDPSKVAAKWARVTAISGPSYQEGIENPRRSWKAGAQAANANFKAAVQAAVANDSFKKGVDRSSDQAWADGAINKGVSRYGAGTALAEGKYEQGFAPFAQVIMSTNLPDRKPKGDPANINRVATMAKALHDKKVSLMAGK